MSEQDTNRIYDLIGAIKDDNRDLKSDVKILRNDFKSLSIKVGELEQGEDMQTGTVLAEIKGLRSDVEKLKSKEGGTKGGVDLKDWRAILIVISVIFGGSAGGNAVVSGFFGQKPEPLPKVEYIYPPSGHGGKTPQGDPRAPIDDTF